MDENKNEVGTIAALAVAAAGAAVVEGPDSRQFLILPKGASAREITDPYGLKAALPRYVRQGVVLQAKDSLAAYISRFKTADTMMFADYEASKILAILDYHTPSSTDEEAAAGNYAEHRAELTLPFSAEWKDWTKIDGAMMSQKDFARWIEEHGADVAAPAAADLLEMCRDLQSIRKVNFIAAVRTNSDAESFEYKLDNDVAGRDGLKIEVPTQFGLSIPIYFGEPNSTLMAYLRWNITDTGALMLGIKLSRAEYVRQAVFKVIVGELAGATECPVVYGKVTTADAPSFRRTGGQGRASCGGARATFTSDRGSMCRWISTSTRTYSRSSKGRSSTSSLTTFG